MNDRLTKVCSKCGKELPLSEFYKDKHTPDGLCYQCKECKSCSDKLYYGKNINKIRLCAQKYRSCVKKPTCNKVGGYGAVFELFTCEICGAKFRRLKSFVDWQYAHRGLLPKYCSQDCYNASIRKKNVPKYIKEIECLKKEVV